MSSTPKKSAAISPEQCMAARGLIRITQEELARRASVSPRTILYFENRSTKPIPATVAAIKRALEEAGVTFIDGNGTGPGVALSKPVNET